MPVATGTMQVTSWDEEPLAELEADDMKLTKASGAQEFSGSIEGAGFVTWLMAYAPTGSARFVGLNRKVLAARQVAAATLVPTPKITRSRRTRWTRRP